MPYNSDDMLEYVSNLSFSQWEEYFSCLSDRELSEISDEASRLAVYYSQVSIYAGYRGAFGCGDSGHEKAMSKASIMRKRIRKVLGYSYP